MFLQNCISVAKLKAFGIGLQEQHLYINMKLHRTKTQSFIKDHRAAQLYSLWFYLQIQWFKNKTKQNMNPC